ncbi:hypothetical protein BH23VER1_BH23VER1_09630 [soil metagenome]
MKPLIRLRKLPASLLTVTALALAGPLTVTAQDSPRDQAGDAPAESTETAGEERKDKGRPTDQEQREDQKPGSEPKSDRPPTIEETQATALSEREKRERKASDNKEENRGQSLDADRKDADRQKADRQDARRPGQGEAREERERPDRQPGEGGARAGTASPEADNMTRRYHQVWLLRRDGRDEDANRLEEELDDRSRQLGAENAQWVRDHIRRKLSEMKDGSESERRDRQAWIDKKFGGGGSGGTEDQPHDPYREKLAQIKHLQSAAEHLQFAGQDDQARKAREEAEKIARTMREQQQKKTESGPDRGDREGPRGGDQELSGLMRELISELKELRNDLKDQPQR